MMQARKEKHPPRYSMLQPLLFISSLALFTASVHACAYGQQSYLSKNFAANNREKRQVTCDSTYPYRSADGTCNNLNNPSWGSVGQQFQRLLAPAYADGLKLPRLQSVSGNFLRSPRDVSTVVHDFDFPRPNPRGTVMLMEWGQFLAHDIAKTPVSTNSTCCSEGLVTGTALHPDVESGGPCFPIIISLGDRHFTTTSSRCMEFVRSFSNTGANGRREQVNMLSAYIDGTNVYGSSQEEMTALRTNGGTGAKLRTYEGTFNLPNDTSGVNHCIPGNDYCLKAGDARVNVYPGLGAMHTLFLRYHNFLVDQLAAKHPSYSNETLFQEARKLLIAVLQVITYQEYLPKILGADSLQQHGLNATWAYNSSCDASLFNVFATAAFRFGHSMVPDGLVVNGVNVSLVDLFLRPSPVLHDLDSLVKGLITSPSERVDRWYSQGMTDHLFEEVEQGGKDVAALNIQRGRDHGLPAYNSWRVFCGLPRLSDFASINFPGRFQQTFDNIDDVDLYSGALAETVSTSGSGSVGPTYACLLGKQFASLRNCDRLFYENPSFFLDQQLQNLKRVRLSHVICQTTGITSIQPIVMTPPGSQNPVTSCTSLLSQGLNINQFF